MFLVPALLLVMLQIRTFPLSELVNGQSSLALFLLIVIFSIYLTLIAMACVD